jgi:hypothetical protein
MFLLRHSVEECATTFKRLARRVFRRPCRFRSALLGRIHGFILSLVTDSLYGAANFEACVREAYGEDTNLFGNPGWNVSGSKYAVTTMTVSDSRLCILSNYNGLGRRRKECGTCMCIDAR